MRKVARARLAVETINALGCEGLWKGARLVGPAHFEVRACRGRVQLLDLWVSPDARCLGWARKLLNKITSEADLRGVPVELRVVPYGERRGARSAKELRAWYGRHGFGPSSTKKGWRVRLPINLGD